jgi:hypothetical protein
VTGTKHNRFAFAGALRRALRPLATQAPRGAAAPGCSGPDAPADATGRTVAQGAQPAVQRLSPGDFHSLLQMLCPDFPAGPVHNAWSAAAALSSARGHANMGTSGGRGGGIEGRGAPVVASGGGGSSGDTVAGADFMAAFEVTWLLQPFLLELRAEAFDPATNACALVADGRGRWVGASSGAPPGLPRAPAGRSINWAGQGHSHDNTVHPACRYALMAMRGPGAHAGKGFETLHAAAAQAAARLAARGWPVPADGAIRAAAALAGRGGAQADFSFGDFVR